MKTSWWLFAGLAAIVACKSESPPPAPVEQVASGVASDAARSTTPVELTILYSSEKKTWLAEQMAAFHGALRDGRPIHVTGKAVGSGEAMTAILDGSEKPVVFSPASTAYTTLLDHAWQSRDNHTKPVTTTAEPLVLSPVVIAMWKPMAETLGWPQKPLGWADILAVSRDPKGWSSKGRPEWGDMKLGHTRPETSSSGLLSVLAIAYAGAHTTRGLTAADLPKVEPFMGSVEDAIVHYGTSTGFFADKMIEHGPSYLSAAVLYENLVIESYAKNPPMPLVAIYPVEGTFWADHPYAVLDAPWIEPAQKEAAATFLAFLKAKPQQTRAMELGFRPVDPSIKIAAPVDSAHGVDPKQPQTLLEVPTAATLEALLQAWPRTKKAADIVFVFDKSGSMAGAPLAEAKRGAKAFLDTLDPRDQVTLIFFDSRVYPPFGPVEVGTAKTELASRIDGISAGGDTALYDATKLAYDLLAKRRSASAHRIRAAVVMTDGVDNKSHLSLATLSRQIGGEDRAATTFTIGYGSQANPTVLGNIASAGAGSFSKGDVSSIIQVYKDLGAFF